MAFGHQQSKPDHLMQSMGVAQKPSQPAPPRSLRDKLSSSPSPSTRQSQSPGHASSPPTSRTSSPGGGMGDSAGAGAGAGLDQLTQDPAQQGLGQQPGQGGLGGGEGQKASREDAGFVPAGQICGGCSMFTKETGDCSAVEGIMQPHDSCQKYYQASNPQAQQEGGLEDALESKADLGGGRDAMFSAGGESPMSRISTMNG